MARQHPDHQQRDKGDRHAVHHPGRTIPVDQGVDEAGPGLEPHHRQKQHYADLPQCQVGTRRHEPVELADAADARQDEGHHQGAARQTQLERRRESRQIEGNGAEQYTQSNADEDRQHLHLLQFLLDVADHTGHGLDGIEPPHQVQDVAKLQAGLAGRHQLDAGPVEARDDHIVFLLDVEIPDPLAEHLLIGDHHPLDPQIRAPGREGGIHLLPEHQQHLVQGVALPHQVQQIPELDARVRSGHHQLVTALEAGTDDIGLVQARDLAKHQAVHVGVAHRDIDGLQALLGLARLLLERGCFFVDLDVKEHANEPHGEQDAADPERVGHRIAHPHQAGGARIRPELRQDLLTRPQRRGVGHGTGEDPEDHRQRHVEQLVQRRGHHAAEQHQQGGEAIELEPRAAQGREEAGTDLDAYGVDEQDQTKFLNEMKCLLIQLQAG